MPQIAQQDYLILYTTNEIASLSDDEKNWLQDKCKNGTIFDVIIELDSADDGLYSMRIINTLKDLSGGWHVIVYDMAVGEITEIDLTS